MKDLNFVLEVEHIYTTGTLVGSTVRQLVGTCFNGIFVQQSVINLCCASAADSVSAEKERRTYSTAARLFVGADAVLFIV